MRDIREIAQKLRDFVSPPPQPPWAAKSIEEMIADGIISVGRGTYGIHGINLHNYRTLDGMWLGDCLHIGSYCSIAPCEVFVGGYHHSDWVSQFPFRMVWDLEGAADDSFGKGDVTIGNDVWIGDGSVLLAGVSVDSGAVVGARAVVTKNVRPYAVVVGNPAREVKRRFDDQTVDRLLELAWWDWPEERIRAELPMLLAAPNG